MTAAQRWLFGVESWRNGEEPVRARDWEVVRLRGDADAKAFVCAHHYSGTYPAARVRFGLFHARTGLLGGVAVFSVPAQPKALDVLPGPPAVKLELGRLVLLDAVPGNAESLLVGECFRQLAREGYSGVLSFSDPTPRTRADGSLLHPGHVGIVYQATNGRYLGRATRRTLDLLPDGNVLSARAQSKVRQLECGWRYVVRQLVAHGATPLEVEGDSPEARQRAAAWLAHWKRTLCRPLRHPGNHRYAWGLDRATARALPPGLPYPRPAVRQPAKWGRKARTCNSHAGDTHAPR